MFRYLLCIVFVMAMVACGPIVGSGKSSDSGAAKGDTGAVADSGSGKKDTGGTKADSGVVNKVAWKWCYSSSLYGQAAYPLSGGSWKAVRDIPQTAGCFEVAVPVTAHQVWMDATMDALGTNPGAKWVADSQTPTVYKDGVVYVAKFVAWLPGIGGGWHGIW